MAQMKLQELKQIRNEGHCPASELKDEKQRLLETESSSTDCRGVGWTVPDWTMILLPRVAAEVPRKDIVALVNGVTERDA